MRCPNMHGGVQIWECPDTQEGIQTNRGFQTHGSVQTYRGYPNIWQCPNMGGIYPYGDIQTYRGCPNMGGPNIQWVIQTYGGCPNMGISKHRGGIQMYRGHVCPYMFGFPLYIHNTKKACFFRLRGCTYALFTLMPPVCLDANKCMGHPKVWGYVNIGGVRMYWGHPNICRVSKHMGASKHMGCPNIQEASKQMLQRAVTVFTIFSSEHTFSVHSMGAALAILKRKEYEKCIHIIHIVQREERQICVISM